MPKPDVQWSQLTIFLTMPLCLRHLDHIFYSCRNQTATPPIAVRNVTESRSIYIKTALLSVYTSSSISIVLDASFFSQMSLQVSTVSGAQWLPLCLAATPHWCYAMLRQSAFWGFFSPSPCMLLEGERNYK